MQPLSLRDRLRGVVQGTAPSAAAAAPAIDRRDHEGLAGLNGTWHPVEGGRAFRIDRRVEPHHRYGETTVGDMATTIDGAARFAPLLAGGTAATPPFIFFDLETTGLSGGAGTHAFLVGCGAFTEDGAFETTQFLLPGYAEERSMLVAVAAHLARGRALVSFNGKSFDAPVLETRYLYHRLAWIGQGVPHIDVLHPARGLWGGAGRGADPTAALVTSRNWPAPGGCSLGELERRVLGTGRIGDVPGAEIPARYFHFIRSGDAAPLAPVLQHNHLDLLSLAALTARVMRLLMIGPAAARDAQEAFALGRLYDRAGDGTQARNAWIHALAVVARHAGPDEPGVGEGRLTVEVLRRLALLERRQRRYDEAAARWRAILEHRDCPETVEREATEALAVHHEHRVRDLVAAKMFAVKVLEGRAAGARTDAARHRLARIERKIVSARRLPFLSSWLSPPASGSLTSARRTSS